MGENTNIEWADNTGNPWWGCDEMADHPGCDNCYAREWDGRYGPTHWGHTVPRRMIMGFWPNLKKWQRKAAKEGKMIRVFVGSMMDIFERSRPTIAFIGGQWELTGIKTGQLRDQLFKDIGEGLYPNLHFLLLTKRPFNIPRMVPQGWLVNPPANVTYGTSASDQKTANKYIPALLKVPGRHFLSLEPLLGRIDLQTITYQRDGKEYYLNVLAGRYSEEPDEFGEAFRFGLPELGRLHWVITGGESGPKKRYFNPNWARDLRGQCQFWRVPFFMKQVDKVQPIPADLFVREVPGYMSLPVGV